jgi:hypothetical protein
MAGARHLRIPGLILVLFALTFITSPAQARYGGGTGEPNDPYLIYTAEQMNAIGAEPNDWDKHFGLMADIDLTELGDRPFNIIGTYLMTPPIRGSESGTHLLTPPFTGVFDGNGHTISGFVLTPAHPYAIGLFSVVADPNAAIRNLTLVAPRIERWAGYAGTLVGYLCEGTLTNCHAENVDIAVSAEIAGGLLGLCGSVSSDGYTITEGVVWDCSATGRVSGGLYATGGLVGESVCGSFYGCFAACEVSGGDYVGGLAGDVANTWFVDCYSRGSVTGKDSAGGLIGFAFSGDVINCYAASRVSAGKTARGFIGLQTTGIHITASFWDAEVSSLPNTADPMGKTTAQMQDPNLFIAAGWDLVGEADGPSDVWAVPPGGGYPALWWQLPDPPALPFAGGTGSPDEPYRIATPEQLNRIAYAPRLMTAHFKLVNDIDLTGVHIYPIGNAHYPYVGQFDGGGFAISSFVYSASEPENVGLFRIVAGGAEIRNLTLAGPEIDALDATTVGSLVALVRGGTLRNCHVAGGHVSGRVAVGGMVGQNGVGVAARLLGCDSTAIVTGQAVVGGLTGQNGPHGLLDNCRTDASVTGDDSIGGLSGTSYDGTIRNCSVAGQVLGRWRVGGLIGQSDDTLVTRSVSRATVKADADVGGLVGINSGTITDCYSLGDVTGDANVGGLVGCNGLSNRLGVQRPGTISKCYAAGHVTGNRSMGGLAGCQGLGSVAASFWDIEKSGLPGKPGEFGKTTAQMQTASTFLVAGWDFVGETENGAEDIWWILEGQDYPRLSWESAEE